MNDLLLDLSRTSLNSLGLVLKKKSMGNNIILPYDLYFTCN